MNFLILKTIIESTIQNYNQQNQMAKVGENNVFVTSLTSKGVDLTIHCPQTNKQVTVHAEVNFMGPMPTNFSVTGEGISDVTGHINDEDVSEIRKALKNTTTISDLFDEKGE